MLQSDLSAQHLSVFGLLTVKKEMIKDTVVAKHRLPSSLCFTEESLLKLHKCSLFFLSLR